MMGSSCHETRGFLVASMRNFGAGLGSSAAGCSLGATRTDNFDGGMRCHGGRTGSFDVGMRCHGGRTGNFDGVMRSHGGRMGNFDGGMRFHGGWTHNLLCKRLGFWSGQERGSHVQVQAWKELCERMALSLLIGVD